VQAAHAILEAGLTFGRPADYHPSIVILSVRNQQELIDAQNTNVFFQ